MFNLPKPRPAHRRDWRRCWRYCRCGYRWRCPDSVHMVPMPYAPQAPPLTDADYRAALRAQAPVPVTPDAPPPPARPRASNSRPGWDAPTRSHLGNGRTGSLTPAQKHRARHGERV